MKTSLSLKMAEPVSKDVINSKEGCFFAHKQSHVRPGCCRSRSQPRHFQVDPTG